MGKLIQSLEKQLTEKGEEINAYMEKHNIQVKDQQGAKKEEGKAADKEAKSGGVLVANWSLPCPSQICSFYVHCAVF